MMTTNKIKLQKLLIFVCCYFLGALPWAASPWAFGLDNELEFMLFTIVLSILSPMIPLNIVLFVCYFKECISVYWGLLACLLSFLSVYIWILIVGMAFAT